MSTNMLLSHDSDDGSEADNGVASSSLLPHPFYLHDLCENERKAAELESLLLSMKSQIDYNPDGDADIEGEDYWDCAPLHVAIYSRNFEAMRVLLQNGAEVGHFCEGSTCLHMAIAIAAMDERVHDAILAVHMLLSNSKVDVLSPDDYGRTPLHLACEIGVQGIVNLLLAAPGGEDALGIADKITGNTPLATAASSGSLSCVEAILAKEQGRHSASIRNADGDSPASLAAAQGHAAIIQQLHAHGLADLNHINRLGQTAAAVAARRGYLTLSNLLQRDGGELTDAAFRGAELAATKVEGRSEVRTLVATHRVCMEHYTIAQPVRRDVIQPNENVARLTTLVDHHFGFLRTSDLTNKIVYLEDPKRAGLADILRVHDFPYIRRIQELCGSVADDVSMVTHLDDDTTISHRSFEAALRAAGSVLHAVDLVCRGEVRNAFCAIRPPGHHAGPSGLVTCANDQCGSHGFCLINNVAIGAAYARAHLADRGIHKVAILDFDVHHGNGTEAIVRNVVPNVLRKSLDAGFCTVRSESLACKPWRDESDGDNILFASVHGYGAKAEGLPQSAVPKGGWFYPGSGATSGLVTAIAPADTNFVTLDETINHGGSVTVETLPSVDVFDAGAMRTVRSENPEPLVINVGLARNCRSTWRRVWRDEVLARVVAFKPDIIFVSAGFDGHAKDIINHGFLGLHECDYHWLTEEIVKVANTVCDGRIVSVLEGGYRINGRVVSPFGRSVQAHVRALADPALEKYDPELWAATRRLEEERGPLNSGLGGAGELKENLDDEAAALRAEVAEMLAEEVPSVSGEKELEEEPGRGGRKRRRGAAPVDYVKLNDEMESERKKARA